MIHQSTASVGLAQACPNQLLKYSDYNLLLV